MATVNRRRVRGEAYNAIKRLNSEGWSPKQIYDALPRELAGLLPTADFPQLRQVERVVKDLRPHDRTGPWSMAIADSEDVRDVLDVLAAITLESEGRIDHITERQASWIIRIRRAAPTLEPRSVFRITNDYMLREDAGEGTADLDLMLAVAPALADEDLALRYVKLHARLWPDRSLPLLPNLPKALGAWMAESSGIPATGAVMDKFAKRRLQRELPEQKARKKGAMK